MKRIFTTLTAASLLVGCGRGSDRYSRDDLAKTLAEPAEQVEAGLVIGEFALAPGAVVDGDTIKVEALDSSLRLLGLDDGQTQVCLQL